MPYDQAPVPHGPGENDGPRVGAPPDRLGFLDGLRGWASLMVVLSHLWGQFARHVSSIYDAVPLRLVSNGHVAVLIFFVLSGVALSLRFVRQPRPVALLGLVVARYVRLVVPIFATTLIVYLLLTLQIAGSPEAAQLAHSEIFLGPRHDIATSFGDVAAFSFFEVLFRYDPHTTFNWSLWTMPIEFFGSLLVYAMLFAFSRVPRLQRPHRIVLAGVLSLALLALSKPLAACFSLGYVVAELIFSPAAKSAWIRWASGIVLAAATALILLNRELDDLRGAVLALGIVMVVVFWPVGRRLFSNPLSHWLGLISFPLYLIHVPVIGCASLLFLSLVRAGLGLEAATHVTMVAALAGCLFAAWLLLPMERCSIRWSRRVDLTRVSAVSAAAETTAR